MIVTIVFISTSLISLLRILITNRDALSTLVWAEDGLFPLCIQAHGYLQCLADPFAGYLLFLSRSLALPVSVFPQSSWPLVTNVVAAVTFGTLSCLVTYLLLRAQVQKWAAVGAGIAPMLLPIVGLETINTAGSAYMLLLIVAAIAVSFKFTPPLPFFVVPLFLLVSAMTIPSSVVFFIPLVASLVMSRRKHLRSTLLNLGALSGGLVIQFYVIFTSDNPRQVALTAESIMSWVQYLPSALLSLIPTLTQLDDQGRVSTSSLDPNAYVGLALLVILGFFAVYLLRSTMSQLRGAGWLLFTGILMGLIPAILGYPNNRYYVVTVITVVIAFYIWLGSVLKHQKRSLLAVIVTITFVAWLPDFGASEFRSTAVPPWSQTLMETQRVCQQDPSANVRYVFSPNWPFEGTTFLGLTSDVANCSIVPIS